MIGKTVSHFKIIDKLGEGGMGIVYLAEDTNLDRKVALKFLPPDVSDSTHERERFIHEAKAASAFNHPNVTTIYEVGETEDGIFIAMEHVDGRTLREITEHETLPIKKVLGLAIQVCEGLHAAHKRDIVHRDVKSENIMVTEGGRVKIMDFGLAKLKGATRLTTKTSTLGTIAYLSPEQAQGEEVDQRSDIFSFGVVLYELLAKRLPFEGDHEAAIIYSIVNEEPQPVVRYNSHVSPKLADIVSKALEKDKGERYQHIDEMLADLRREKKSLEYAKTGQIAIEVAKPKRSILPYSIPALAVLVAVVLFLIFKPFGIEITPEKEAIAQENTLAVMYFENLVDPNDPQRLAEIVTNLLITDLSESRYVKVVSSQRLYDILKQLGREGVTQIDRSVASQVADRAKAKWMLLGSILQAEPEMVLTSQLVEVQTGNVIASQRITAEPDEQVFSMVDRLTVELKKDLALPVQAQTEADPRVADVTTHSPEAYRYYVEGEAAYRKMYDEEAIENLLKAVEYDSTFAMAYFMLAIVEDDEDELKEYAAKAVKYSDKGTQLERYLAKSIHLYATGELQEAVRELEKAIERFPDEKMPHYVLGQLCLTDLRDTEKALYHFLKVIEIDPLDKMTYNLLAYRYDDLGDFERSLWAINKYIEIAPDEPNPYDTRGDLYAYRGDIDNAIASYTKALEIKPDFYVSLRKLGHMHLFKREYAEAESCYQTLCSVPDKSWRSSGRRYLSLIPMCQGRFAESMAILDEGIAADRMEKMRGAQANKHLNKAFMYQELGRPQDALDELNKAVKINYETYGNEVNTTRVAEVLILAETGRIAVAEERLAILERDVESQGAGLEPMYWYAAGVVEIEKGDGDEAVRYFGQWVRHSKTFLGELRYGQSHLLAGNLADAVKILEGALILYDVNRITRPLAGVKAHYLLGQAYEESGWTDKAIEQYETFLDIMHDPDPGILSVEDAKQRLERLKTQS
jgi:serine/threonine protein kinase/tetratricopeptide (TPR) repeat protein